MRNTYNNLSFVDQAVIDKFVSKVRDWDRLEGSSEEDLKGFLANLAYEHGGVLPDYVTVGDVIAFSCDWSFYGSWDAVREDYGHDDLYAFEVESGIWVRNQ